MIHKLLAAVGLVSTPPAPSVKPDVARSPQWPGVRAAHIKANPTCAACGGKDHLEVHHCRPFHLHPDLELDPKNLITLCESPGRDCHCSIGHLMDWKAFNPTVRMDAAWMLSKIKNRPYQE